MADDSPLGFDQVEILRSLASRSKTDRIAAADSLATLVAGSTLSDQQRQNAHNIIEELSSDAEQIVRASVAHAIAEYPLLPPSISEKLATDVLEVSAPVLRSAPTLSDTLLINLIASGRASEDAQVLIATRDALSALVSGSLLKEGKTRAVETVLSNETAQIDEDGYSSLLARDDLDADMLSLAAARPDLPAPVVAECHTIALAEHFERKAGRRIRDTLIENHSLPPEMANDIVQAALEDVLAHSIAKIDSSQEDLVKLATNLHQREGLTPSLLLRMTCDGSLDFVAASFHVLTGRSIPEVYAAFNGAGIKPLTEQYHQSNLAPYFRFALVTAIKRIAKERAKPYAGAPDKPVQDIIREIVGFYRGIAPTSLDQVIARLCHEASRWSEDNETASSSA